MTERPALEIATAYLDAFTGKDLEKAGGYLAEDFTLDGPIAHYRSAEEFLAGATRFAESIRPGWTQIAAFGDEREALLLYDLAVVSGATMRIADHLTVSDGKIQTETVVWDTHGFR